MAEGVSAVLIGTGSYEGEMVVTNADLEARKDTRHIYLPDGTPHPEYSPSKLESIAGIARRVKTAVPLTTMMDLAAADCVDSTTRSITDAGLVIFATNSICRDIRDVSEDVIPRLRERYGVHSWNPRTYTIVSGCPGGEVAEDVARQFIETGQALDVLVVTAEILETDPHDMNAGLFSDVAGAARYLAVPDGEISGESRIKRHEGKEMRGFDPLLNAYFCVTDALLNRQSDIPNIDIIVTERHRGLMSTIVPPDAAFIQGALVQRMNAGMVLNLEDMTMGALDVITDHPDGKAACEIAERYVESGAVKSAVAVVIRDDGTSQAWHYLQQGSIERTRSRGILDAFRQTDGTKREHIIQGPSYNPDFDPALFGGFNNFFHVDNHAVYEDAVEGVPRAISSLLRSAYAAGQDPLIFSHNTNMKMIEGGAIKLAKLRNGHPPTWEEVRGLLEHTMPINIRSYGNCSCASVQFLRDEVFKGTLPRGSVPSTQKSSQFKGQEYTIGPGQYMLAPGRMMIDTSVGAGMTLWGKLQRLDEIFYQMQNPEYWASRQIRH